MSKIRIAPKEYEFIEWEGEGTPVELVKRYTEMQAERGESVLWETLNESLRSLVFNKKLDSYLSTGEMEADVYEGLDRPQKMAIQLIKRAFARINKE